MKKFNEKKSLKSFEDSKLTKIQMELTKGGRRYLVFCHNSTGWHYDGVINV